MSESLPAYARRADAHPGWDHNYNRTSDGPPTYADSVRWFFYNSLRPAFLVTSLVSAFAAAILCAIHWRSASDWDGKYRLFSIVSAALFTACALLQLFAFLAGLYTHMGLLRTAVRLSFASAGIAVAAQVVAVANVYANHNSVFEQCMNAYVAGNRDKEVPDQTVADVPDAPSASEVCADAWDADATWNVVVLVLLLIVCAAYLFIAQRYVHKVENPGGDGVRENALLADDNHDFGADVDDDTYALNRFPRRGSMDTLDTHDRAALDAKIDPMADIYGGRRDPADMDAFDERASMEYPPLHPNASTRVGTP